MRAHCLLIVDDNSDWSWLIETAFSKRGFECLTAKEPEAALALVRGGAPIDAVVASLDMPSMHAIELAEALSADPGSRNLPVVLLATNERLVPQNRVKGLPISLIPKDGRLDSLLTTVEDLIAAREQLNA